MAWTRQGKAARLLARFGDAAVDKAKAEADFFANPTDENHRKKHEATMRFNMLRGTAFKVILASPVEL